MARATKGPVSGLPPVAVETLVVDAVVLHVSFMVTCEAKCFF